MLLVVTWIFTNTVLAADLKDVLTPLVRHVGGETVTPFVGLCASSKEMRQHVEKAFLQANPILHRVCALEKTENQDVCLKWKFFTSYWLPSQPLVCLSFMAKLHKLWAKVSYESSLSKTEEPNTEPQSEKVLERLDLDANPYPMLKAAFDFSGSDKNKNRRLKEALTHARHIFQNRWNQGKSFGIQDLDFFALFLRYGLGGPVDYPTSVEVVKRLQILMHESFPHPSFMVLHLQWKELLPGYLMKLNNDDFPANKVERLVALLRHAFMQSQELYHALLCKSQQWNATALVVFVVQVWSEVSQKTEDLRLMIGALQTQGEAALSLDLIKKIVERSEVDIQDIRSILFCGLNGIRMPEMPHFYLHLIRHPACTELDASLVLSEMRITHPIIAWTALRRLLEQPIVPNPWVLRESLLLLENFNTPEVHLFLAELFVRHSPLTLDQFFGAEVFLKLGYPAKATAIFEASNLDTLPPDDWECAIELGARIGNRDLCQRAARIFAYQRETTPEDWDYLELLVESYGFQCCNETKLELCRRRLRDPSTSREQLKSLAKTFVDKKMWKDAHSAWILIEAKSQLSLEESIDMQKVRTQVEVKRR